MNNSEVTLADVLKTERLARGKSKPYQLEQELRGLDRIAQAMSASPEKVLDMLCELALDATGSHSAGVSWLLPGDDGFRWIAIAGRLSSHVGTVAPRFHSPCGTVLDRHALQLFSHPERYFQWLECAGLPVPEGMIVPLFSPGGKAQGTFWVVRHEAGPPYDWQDAQMVTAFVTYASSALQILGWFKGETDGTLPSLART